MQQPIAIQNSSAHQTLPEPLRDLLQLRHKAESLLLSPALEAELNDGQQGPQAQLVGQSLKDLIKSAQEWKSKAPGRKITAMEEARGDYMQAWALARVGEYDDAKPLAEYLDDALQLYQKAADLIKLPTPPTLAAVPSVTRPNEKTLPPALAEQPAWVGEFLSEWARATTTLAFSLLLQNDEVIKEEKLADLLDWSCRRNVQGEGILCHAVLMREALNFPHSHFAALFTPLDPATVADETNPSEAGTVMGNATLIKDVRPWRGLLSSNSPAELSTSPTQMSTMYPFSSDPSLWIRRLSWATHVADVRFVEASMSANRLVDAASASASILQSPDTTDSHRSQVRGVLESTLKRLMPFERVQAGCLLSLGRTMLKGVGELYLGRKEEELGTRRKRDESRDSQLTDEGNQVPVPENELVRETRQVLIRAAGLYENVYASFRRAPVTSKTTRQEQRLLRRLESAYCDLEALDNDTPEVQELRSQRVERAVWINNRLLALGSEGEDSNDEHPSSGEDSGESDDSDDDGEEIARRFARHHV